MRTINLDGCDLSFGAFFGCLPPFSRLGVLMTVCGPGIGPGGGMASMGWEYDPFYELVSVEGANVAQPGAWLAVPSARRAL